MKNILLAIFIVSLSFSNLYAQKKKKREEPDLPNKTGENMSRNEEKSDDRQTTLSAERELLNGMKFSALENYTQALESYQKALKINPKSSGIHYQIAETLFKQKKYSEAAVYAEKAIDLEDNNKYYYILLANIYQMQGQYEKAAQTYEKMLAKKIPATDIHQYDLAQIYQFRIKDYPKALKIYDNLEKKYGVQVAINQAKQIIYTEQKNYPAALAEAEKLATQFPENNDLQLSYAQVLLEAGQESKAEKFLEQHISKDYSFLSHLLLLKVYQKQNKENQKNTLLSKVLENKDTPEEVRSLILKEYAQSGNQIIEKSLDKIAEQNPQDASSWLLYAQKAEKNKEYEKARDAYLKVVVLDGTKFEAWQKLLWLDTELSQAEELLTHSEQALELYPTQATFWLYNGIAFFESKQYKKALNSFEQGLELVRNNTELQIQLQIRLADVHFAQEQHDKAEKILEDILSKNPQNTIALNNYSYYLALRKQKLDLALKNSKKLAESYPNNHNFQATYGVVLYKQNKLQEAKKVLEKALSIKETATIAEHYGDVLFKLGEKEKALSYWQKAQNMRGGSQLLAKKLINKQLYE
ncbi:MAG: tetratricopeptide repeat protein [Raineya sp.]